MGVGSALSTASWVAYGGYVALCSPVVRFATASTLIVSAPYLYFKHFRPSGDSRKIITDWTRYTLAPEVLTGAALYASFTIFPPLPKFLGFVAYSVVCSPVGRFAIAFTSAIGIAYLYKSSRATNKIDEKWSDLTWDKLVPEGLAIAGLIASFSIFRPGFLLNQLAGVDATFAGLPYKLVSLCGSGISTAGNFALTYALTTKATYLVNPLKIADWLVFTIANNLTYWTKAYITNLQLQRGLYGYEVGNKDETLSGLELYNLDLQSLKLLGFSIPFAASSVRSMGSMVFSWLGYPIPYLNRAINMAGLTPVANVLTTIASTAFTTTALSAGSIALSGISIGISIVTQVRLADSFSIYNASYEAAIKEQQKVAKELDEKIEYANKLLSADNKAGKKFFSDYAKEPKVKEVLLDFSKFKDKSKSDYIYAFAIKLLETECGANPVQIKLLMLSVIMNKDNFNNYVAHLADPENTKIFTGITDFTQHAKTMDGYLTYALNNLGVKIKRADIKTSERCIDPPLGTFITADENLRDGIPEKITDFEAGLLTKIDNAVEQNGIQCQGQGPTFAAAVQVLLQKVNAIEKAAPGMMETAANFVVDIFR